MAPSAPPPDPLLNSVSNSGQSRDELNYIFKKIEPLS